MKKDADKDQDFDNAEEAIQVMGDMSTNEKMKERTRNDVYDVENGQSFVPPSLPIQ